VNEVVNEIVENKLSHARQQIGDLQAKTRSLDEDVMRMDENMFTMNDGLLKWYKVQNESNNEMLKRVSGLEEFVEKLKTSVSANGGVNFWNQAQE
jgi:L-lactate utilization protein LutB